MVAAVPAAAVNRLIVSTLSLADALGTQSRPSSCRPVLHVSAFTITGLVLRLPATLAAMQKGKHDVPTARSEHCSAGSRSHRGVSHIVASTLSQVPLVRQSIVGRLADPAPNGTTLPSTRRTGHRTLRTVISTLSHVSPCTHVESWNHTSVEATPEASVVEYGRNEHRMRIPWSVFRQRQPISVVV